MPSRSQEGLSVMLGWGLAGAAAGAAVGTVAWVSGHDNALLGLGLAGAAIGAVAGRWADRSVVGQVLVGDREVNVSPAWVLWVPVGVAAPSLAGMGVVLTAVTGGLAPLVVLGGLAVGTLAGATRAHRRGRLSRALAGLEAGDPAARSTLSKLAVGTGPTSRAARLALAMDDLRVGDLTSAAGRLVSVEREGGPSAGSAAAALALVCVLQGRSDAALAAVGRALSLGGAAVQAQTDAVRVLLVWRSEGESSAHELAERVLGGSGTVLLIGLAAALRSATGDEAGGRALLTPEVRALLAHQRWAAQLPELAGVCG